MDKSAKLWITLRTFPPKNAVPTINNSVNPDCGPKPANYDKVVELPSRVWYPHRSLVGGERQHAISPPLKGRVAGQSSG